MQEIKLTVRVRLLPQKFTLALLHAMTPVCLIISGDKAKLPLIIVNWFLVERKSVCMRNPYVAKIW